MSRPGASSAHMRAPRFTISLLAVVAVAVGAVLGSAPAQAADLSIASVEVGSPATATGIVRATVKVDAPAGARVTYSVAKPAKGSASISTRGALTYTPTAQARHRAAKDGAKAADRADSVHITVTDATGQRASKKVPMPILGANQAPVIANVVVGQPDPRTGVVQGRIVTSDPDGDPLSYQVTSDTSSVSSAKRSMTLSDLRPRSLQAAPDNGTTIVCPSSKGSLSLTAATGAFTYTPTATARITADAGSSALTAREYDGFADIDTFTVKVNDGYGGSVSVPVSVPTGSYGGGIQ